MMTPRELSAPQLKLHASHGRAYDAGKVLFISMSCRITMAEAGHERDTPCWRVTSWPSMTARGFHGPKMKKHLPMYKTLNSSSEALGRTKDIRLKPIEGYRRQGQRLLLMLSVTTPAVAIAVS